MRNVRIRTFLLMLFVLLSLAVGVSAQGQNGYVVDEYGLLDAAQLQQLEAHAAQVSEGYDCGVYVLILEDHRTLGEYDPFVAAYTYYHARELGVGADRDGVLLMLSMAQRDYAIFVYGDGAEYALDDYGVGEVEDAFLDELGNHDWYDGLEEYIAACENALHRASSGEPIRQKHTLSYAIAYLVAALIAFFVCLSQYTQMRTARKRTEAGAYVTPGSVEIKARRDIFVNQTVQVVNTGSSGSGGGRSGGGGHGRSGKF